MFPTERAFTRRVRSFDVLVFVPHIFHFVLLLGIAAIGPRVGDLGVHVPHVIRPLVNLVGLLFELFLAIHRALFSLVNIGYGVAGAVLLIDSYRRARVPRLKQQLRVIAAGLVLCLALYTSASSVPTLLNLSEPEWLRSVLTIAALTVGSGAIAWSMVRYKFLDTKLLARRGILYAVASAVLVGIYLGVVQQLNLFLSGFLAMDTRVFEPVFLIMALILFQPVLGRLEERLDLFFLRDPSDYRNVLKNLGRDLLTKIDLDDMLAGSITTVAEALMIRNAYVVALAREGAIVHTGAGKPPDPGDRAALPEVLLHLDHGIESFRLYGPEEQMPRPDRAFLVNRFHTSLLIPLRSKGETVGALLLGDKITGTEYTAEDVNLLSALAAQMSISLQNGLLLRERVAVVRIEEELNLARRIQKSFLPSRFPPMARFDVHAVNTPSRQVGGDFYDLVPTGDGTYYLAIADVSGKGVPAALLTSMLQASLRTQADATKSVSSILANINSLVVRSTTTEQFATFFLARLDEATLTMSFSNAGHNYPVLCRKNGDRLYLERGGMILGMFEGLRFEEETLDLFPGDRVVLYTDGITEAVNAKDDDFGEERLADLIRSLPPELTAREMTGRILDALSEFLEGAEPQDDITVMVLRVLEPSETLETAPRERVGVDAR